MRHRLSLAVAAVLIAGIGLVAVADAGPRDTASLFFFEDESRAGGQSILVRDGAQGTISAKINATHLEPGHAYTYWWVVFDDPSQCEVPFECGEADLFTDVGLNVSQIDAVGISVLGGNGEIANNGGRATFTGRLFADTGAGHDVVVGPGGALLDAGDFLNEANVMTAEIHIVLRDHGPALSGAALADQLLTFAGNCTAASSAGLGDGDFTCIEPQFAVHK